MTHDLNALIAIDHCVIASSDLDRTDAFYARVFGARIARPMEQFRQYRIGEQMLNVHGPGAAAIATPQLLAWKPVAPGGSDLCFEWKGTADDLAGHLAACGVEVTVGPVARDGARGQGSSVYFSDPDGSLLEFIIYPPA